MAFIEKGIQDHDVPQADLPRRRTSEFEGFYGFLLLLLLWLILSNSGLFVVNEVKIVGNQTLTKPEISKAARLDAHQTLFQIAVNKSRIQRDLLHEIRIAASQISLRFPNQVIITIKERTPLCLLENERNLLVISNDGIVLGKATGAEDDLPIISGLSLEGAAIGAKVGGGSLKPALTIIRKADENIQRALRKINLRKKQLSLDFPDSDHTIVVELGNMANITTKMANLRAILTHTDLRRIKEIDLRVAELPSIIKANGKPGF